MPALMPVQYSSMFKRSDQDELSTELQDDRTWKPGIIRVLTYPQRLTVLAYEPCIGILAYGTGTGTIFLHGQPGVDIQVDLPDRSTIAKFLQISASTSKLLCIDDQHKLHVWDLSAYKRPKYLASARFQPVSSIVVSPSHSHAFISLQSGEVRTYDLECLRKSSYTVPNLWKVHEEKLAASGISEETSHHSASTLIETVIHPRDINLIFTAYAGGVVLFDLKENHPLHTYQLFLPPGAPGGSGYGSHDVMTHRHPEVTCLAIHPSGHIFVVGYTDGIFAFWAMEDEDQPLMVRTLTNLNVNVVDGIMLEKAMKRPEKHRSEREPVFKLSWSGLSNASNLNGEETVLTILGGLILNEPPGVTTFLLPAFKPADPSTYNQPDGQRAPVPAGLRSAMRESLEPVKTYFYGTSAIAQEYVLLPKESPHFSGVFDPTTILILTESASTRRVLDAYEFPPPIFGLHPTHPTHNTVQGSTGDEPLSDISTTLRDLQIEEEPRHLGLPSALWKSSGTVVGGHLITVERDSYDELISASHIGQDALAPIHGGVAWADPTDASEQKLSKYQPHRIWITYHLDQTVQFQDASAQLLLGYQPTPIRSSFPSPLPSLTIDLSTLLGDPQVHKFMGGAMQASIRSVHFATESLDCVIVLDTGYLAVYRLNRANAGPETIVQKQSFDPELFLPDHIQKPTYSRYFPYCLLAPRSNRVVTCAMADIGFLAVAYSDAYLVVVDLRTPRIILKFGAEDKPKHKLTMAHLPGQSMSFEAIASLVWTISPLETDHNLRLRLLVVYMSGRTRIFTIVRGDQSSQWIAVKEPVKFDMEGKTLAQGAFILNSKTGAPCKADRSRASAAGQGGPSDEHVVFLTAGVEGAKCNADISGDRIAKVDWDEDLGRVVEVQVVEKTASHALVVLTDQCEVAVYSLPFLRCLHRFSMLEVSPRFLTMDETGDYIVWHNASKSSLVQQVTYGTLFNSRRVNTLPEFELLYKKRPIPPHPRPVSLGPTSLLSWFNSDQVMTGEQIDTLLGGTDRPVPEKELVSSSQRGEHGMPSTSGTTNLYERLTSALTERGQALGILEERFNALETESRNMVTQAKKLATEQAAKSWFKI